jgi:hypothetical protein
MASAASSAAAHACGRPAESATAAATRYGAGAAQTWPDGMPVNSSASDRPPRGSMIWPIAS